VKGLTSVHGRWSIILLAIGMEIPLVGTAGAVPPAPAPAAARAREAFAARVRPILNANCFQCHGSEKPKRGLDLTQLETLFAGGKSGPPIVPGRPDESLLYRALQAGAKPHMPPTKQLAAEEIAAVGAWIHGLPPDLTLEALVERGPHWAFRKVERVEPPAVERAAWVRTPIDAFILARLEGSGIAPSPDAPRADLIRRATFDLTGLPPAPEEVEAFLRDESADAFEKVVDRLLDSPAYGERWGRHWLDLARFAESEGFKSDEARPNAWRYRDYVIESLNEDKPYDRFVMEQIAGDELWPDDVEARLATAFNRHYPDESNARDLYQRRQEILNDITDTVGSVFTGLTVGCARCHDHKYDPIPQADYYRLQSFFANVRAVDDLLLAPAAAVDEHHRKLAAWEDKTRHLTVEMSAIEEEKRKQIARDNFDKFPPEIQAAITKPEGERTPLDWQMFHKAKPYLHPDLGTIVAGLSGDVKKRWEALKKDLDRFEDIHPDELPVGSAIADTGLEAPKTHLLSGGAYDAPAAEVEPGFYTVLHAGPPRIEPPAGLASSGRRAALARWLADPANPLTARVLVNRLWHYHFGRGIVGTPSDFGAMGDPPTHPDLLDWLATELVRGGWSMKRIHRLIMASSVYRQASAHRPEAARIDPGNRLWWRFPRQRLEAEAIRDAALAVAGLLDLRVGGPSVFPELPAGVDGYGKWSTSKDRAARNRRSVYIFVRRNTRYPMLEAFDFPDTHESCARRHATITAPQALTLLNGKLTLEWAQAFAGRLLVEAGSSRSTGPGPSRSTGPGSSQPTNPGLEPLIARAYWIAFYRPPDAGELATALAFLDRQRAIIAERSAAGEEILLPSKMPEGLDPALAAALVDFCHMVLNANEFIDRT
jgi:mono/diheme cytochrome c family protein